MIYRALDTEVAGSGLLVWAELEDTPRSQHNSPDCTWVAEVAEADLEGTSGFLPVEGSHQRGC